MRTHRSLPLVGLLSCLLTVSAAEAAPFVGGHVGFGLGYVAGQDDGLEIPSDPTFAFSTKTEADGGLLSLSARSVSRRERAGTVTIAMETSA